MAKVEKKAEAKVEKKAEAKVEAPKAKAAPKVDSTKSTEEVVREMKDKTVEVGGVKFEVKSCTGLELTLVRKDYK